MVQRSCLLRTGERVAFRGNFSKKEAVAGKLLLGIPVLERKNRETRSRVLNGSEKKRCQYLRFY